MENEYAGQGGSYAIDEDGQRKLIQRTEDAPPARAPAPPDEPAAPDQPAPAGFFTSVSPATPDDQSNPTPEKT
ncbi:hypothetical protein [Duganella sp. BJB476]|uniref:hypothetical protein n=1 Tax=Duganella sp. BJB476 TaxID=1871176 RepID=UPI000E34F04B|nr:hypothetical protein [Duganella sp. BJB476]RFP32417.1 hypothetical protein D0T21_09435 [Duganella sp. BJB476]